MNCELCHENLDAYRAGSLPHDMRIQVEAHLTDCKDCAEIFSLLNHAEEVIMGEKEQELNPFLSTRIMAAIETAGTEVTQTSPVFIRVMKPVVITMSLAVALFIGIVVGNFSNSVNNNNAVPLELTLINDVDMEAVSLLSNE